MNLDEKTAPFRTSHQVICADARDRILPEGESVDLVVTSPPYPMIRMWDELFSGFSREIEQALQREAGGEAFELMHRELDKVWMEVFRLLRPGGFLCVNIGDAVRSLAGEFGLYPNHSRILSACLAAGFSALPLILWRKQTNAPNKFMGSGMLPAGAYVTLEHEYILVFRKGGKRHFRTDTEKQLRRESGFFWEERNSWFSDLWEFKGTGQKLKKGDLRERSAAYPQELAERLILMYSLYGDTVFDPFLGTGTTSRAAVALGRNSIGLEIDPNFMPLVFEDPDSILETARTRTERRAANHISFMEDSALRRGKAGYGNIVHGFPVITRQETGIRLRKARNIESTEGAFPVWVDYESLSSTLL